MNFSERLEKALAFRQVSQADLARAAKINQSQLSSYVKGKVRPSLRTTIKIADALSININYLLGFVDDVDVTYLEELLNKILTLSTAEKICVIDYIDTLKGKQVACRKESVWRN